MNATLQFHSWTWHGHLNAYCMFMTQEVFQRYFDTYTQLFPLQEEVMQHISQLSYWAYARYDPNIHFMRLPDCILQQERRQR